MRTFFIIAAFALALVSCADDTIWWDLPPDMTDVERASFGEGIELDNEIAIRKQFIAPPGDGNRRVFLHRRENLMNFVDLDGDGTNDTNGEESNGWGVMNLARGQDPKSLVMVVAHEGMHAAGMHKHHDGPGIMNPNGLKLAKPSDPVAFSSEDVEACKRQGACH